MNMHPAIAAIVILVSLLAQSETPEQTAVLGPVRQLFESFNKGDATTAVAGCADVTSIIDDFPPHQWLGPGACARWMNAYKAYAKANGIADMVVTLSAPKHVDVTADRAYVVVPADYTLKRHGQLVTSKGSIVTIVLRKSAVGWRITSWAWADP